MDKGRKFLSDLKLYSDYLGWREELGRYETWEEAVEEVFDTHRGRYAAVMNQLAPHLKYAEDAYKEMRFLAAQRNLQFRGPDIYKHNFRLYNCLVMYADRASFLGNAFYLLLCGCGVGVNMQLPFVSRLPKIAARTKGVKTFVIEDNIEGWGDAAHALASSYVAEGEVAPLPEYQGYVIKFDYSKIRKKGARLGRRFKAPGPDGLKTALEKIEAMMDAYVEEFPKAFTSLLAYDFFMYLADSVLSGGVRRAACSIMCSPEDRDLIYAKSGNWREQNPQRARSNNSVALIRGEFSKEFFEELLRINQGTSDIGFVFVSNIFEVLNPCFEIGFTPLFFDYSDYHLVERIMRSDISVLDEGVVKTAIQCCNLNEINGAMLKTKADVRRAVIGATITGTLQAGYTDFRHIRDIQAETIAVSEYEALLGVSITGWAANPWLFNREFLEEMAQLVIETNEMIARIIGIRPAARSCTVKPSGNSSVVLGTPNGIHWEHSHWYFRVMQLNKETDAAKWLEQHMRYILEEGGKETDWSVYVPIENEEGTLYKDDYKGVKHLEIIRLVKEAWVDKGKVASRCIIPTTSHNVSNTVIIDDYEAIVDYLFAHQYTFTAVSFMGEFGDKDYQHCPNTSVLSFEEIHQKYGDGCLFASGLVVDALAAFDENLWRACEVALDKSIKLAGTRREVFYQKDIIRRIKKFARNYFKGDVKEATYCLKDVHLLHKWKTTLRQMREVDFTKILTQPVYLEVDAFAGAACNGGVCEITRI
jgi:ribonucleoside-diphosphate reductase alpha chain